MTNLNKIQLLKPNVRQPCYRQRVVALKIRKEVRHRTSLAEWMNEWDEDLQTKAIEDK